MVGLDKNMTGPLVPLLHLGPDYRPTSDTNLSLKHISEIRELGGSKTV